MGIFVGIRPFGCQYSVNVDYASNHHGYSKVGLLAFENTIHVRNFKSIEAERKNWQCAIDRTPIE